MKTAKEAEEAKKGSKSKRSEDPAPYGQRESKEQKVFIN